MRICEYGFLDEDPNSPGYSMAEVDYYAWIPAPRKTVPNHRLSLRKNLVTGEWEFFRVYYSGTTVQQIRAGRECAVMISHTPSGIEEVAFKSVNFEEALKYGNEEYARWHGPDGRGDEPCTHGDSGTTATFCPVVKGLVDIAAPKAWR